MEAHDWSDMTKWFSTYTESTHLSINYITLTTSEVLAHFSDQTHVSWILY